MALWRIVVKNSGNAACKNKRQRLEKGMFIETSTTSTNTANRCYSRAADVGSAFHEQVWH